MSFDTSYIREISNKIDNLINDIMKSSTETLLLAISKPENIVIKFSDIMGKMGILINTMDGLVITYGDSSAKNEWERIKKDWQGLTIEIITKGQMAVNDAQEIPKIVGDLNSILNRISSLKWQILYRTGFLPKERGYSLAERIGESLSILVVDDILEELEKHFSEGS